tara:strand:- start:3169 stop:4674 length:1506 start_codon:yes stop_codon:yes gene_type:complete
MNKFLIVLCAIFLSCNEIKEDKPNILFISIDDLNDWNEPLNGNNKVFTPFLKKFSKESVNFTKNYCASPGCNPSRASMLTGIHTYNSGMYSNYQDWRKVPILNEATTLPQLFKENGYFTAGAGKIYHYSQVHPESWNDYFPSQKQNMPSNYIPEDAPVNMPPFEYMYSAFDWADLPIEDEETGDYKSVDYISSFFEKDHDKPFFLACGIYRPHLPWYVPKKYFDMYPLENIELPILLENDTSDLGERAKELISRGGNYHKNVVENGKWKEAIRGYLASISYADAMVGKLIENLNKSKYADNTIVVIWSDHGWQLGEKMHWRKFALWENVIRTLLMVKVPENSSSLTNGSSSGREVNSLTSLLDIYPTLIDLAGIQPKSNLDGKSLVQLIDNPDLNTDRKIITTYDFADYSLRYKNWHYINYVDGSEELYDLENDNEEWNNLAYDKDYISLIKDFRNEIPQNPVTLPKESLIELQEHHIPPVISREFYFSDERKEWLKRFKN